jgi:type I restriction enzyme R subunit
VGIGLRANAFTRAYVFLASILPYANAGWEKPSIFLNFLISKLPAPKEDDLPQVILESIDMIAVVVDEAQDFHPEEWKLKFFG